MSSVIVEGNISGTGSVTIAAPNTNSDFTVTLPNNSGTIVTQNSTPAFASTIGVGGATAAASGAGITFPAMQSASTDANTLDDYEEGTFQPSWSSTSASFTYDANFRHGRYTKIGNTVYFNIYISTSGAPTGTTSNRLRITGLPFTSGNTDNANICGLTFGLIYNVDWPANKIMATANNDRNSTFVDLRWEQDSAVSVDWIASNLLASCYVIVSGFYFV
jgi:hypothetical protein